MNSRAKGRREILLWDTESEREREREGERRYAENVTNRHLGSHACVATRVQPRGLVGRYGCRATTVYSSFRSSVTLSLTIRVIELNSEGRKKRSDFVNVRVVYRDQSIAFVVIVIAG